MYHPLPHPPIYAYGYSSSSVLEFMITLWRPLKKYVLTSHFSALRNEMLKFCTDARKSRKNNSCIATRRIMTNFRKPNSFIGHT
jgi:hypothetical protein